MAHSKKYGTFAAVFTPSLLTIIGAIMYLRLGWIVGQAGLYKTLIIIAIAHIISFSTGLSISSIATDKRIKSGGIYYILSRSLGLPMGGAIGIAISLAMILTIALQIIAFSESFLSIEPIANFLGLVPGIPAYRLIGTITLILIAVIALISTSSAIKTQYFVLGAVILSIISIILGFIINTDIHPVTPNLSGIDTQLPFMVLFGIFFPAATGFTTGVAMSGDLKDPKKSIPVGVMSAIATGFVTYITLAICFAFFVDRNLLLTDTNFLTKVAWNPTLVYLGIWGATISTALGSILGAPRILQAIGYDKIIPQFFAKGYGKNNEPRNALIFIIILAECFLLIGDLNVIAPIATMFFMVSYAFINLAFVLEKWSSTDFRPSFNVSRYIGLVGFIACIFVMFELNKVAMLLSFLVMGLLYLYIRRKKIQLEYGDVWQSVLLTITRNSLRRISKRKLENRNWQPNVIVFSGGNDSRPYLVDFGKWLIGKHGFLSNFNLKITTDNKFYIADDDNSIIEEGNKDQWIEAKIYKCRNIYEGIETISGTYGFTGIEPNTIILGFDNTTADHERFSQMLSNISSLSKNILMMHFNDDNGFGNKKIIDIWITPGEQDIAFTLNLVKLLWTNENWSQSSLRINVVSNNNSAYSFIYNKLNTVINQMRIVADIRIINNGIDGKSVHSLIESHSTDSDLIFVAMPDFTKNPNVAYSKIYDISKIAKTIIFVEASKDFMTLSNFDIVTKHIITKPSDTPYHDIALPLRPEAAEFVITLKENLAEASRKSVNVKIDVLQSYLTSLLDNINNSIEINYKKLDSPVEIKKYMAAAANMIKMNVTDLINNKLIEYDSLTLSIDNDFFNEINSICNSIPKDFTVLYNQDISYDSPDDSKELLKLKRKIRKYYKKNTDPESLYQYKVNISNAISFYLYQMYNEIISEVYTKIKALTVNYYYDLTKIVYLINDVNIQLIKKTDNKDDVSGKEIIKSLQNEILVLKEGIINSWQNIYPEINNIKTKYLNEIIDYFNIINFGDISFNFKRTSKKVQESLSSINEDYKTLSHVFPNILNRVLVNIDLTFLKVKLYVGTEEIISGVKDYIDNVVVFKHKSFLNSVKTTSSIDQIDIDSQSDTESGLDLYTLLNEVYDRIIKVIQRQTNTITVISNDSLTQYETSDEEIPKFFEFSVSRLMDYILQNYYYKHIKSLLGNLMQYCQNSLGQEKSIVTQLSFIDNYKTVVDKISEMINAEIDKLNDNFAEEKEEVFSVYELTFEKLQLETFITNAENIKNIVNIESIFNKKDKIVSIPAKISNFFRHNFTQFWYKRSSGKNYANYLVERDSDQERLRKYFNDISKVTLKQSVDKELPYTYKQLYSASQHYNKDLWVGKSKEINDFKIYLTQYQRLRQGAIIITGNIGTGKSFFSYHVAKNLLPGSQIYNIKSVTGGSHSVNKFERAFVRSIDAAPTSVIEKVIEDIPKGSVFIFDNIEQWWHRNEGGNNVIDKLISMIETYSKDYLFILTANNTGFNAMKLTTNINKVVVGNVSLSPFNAQELEAIIMRRHKAGSYKFVINGKNEDSFHQWNYAKLFTGYYRFTDGNISSALKLWLSCIDKVTDETIYIHEPKLPESIPFQLLTRQQIIFLAQFVIHNSMSFERIFAISKRSMNEVKQDINILIRYGLIEKVSENIFAINTVLYPFIISELKQIEII
ncbi:MAG: AAA family ATPase [Bacteroidales bacterium]|jgi:amino acid transporter|nr:AAA family ATPase [Bacteroidales bacterium]